MSAPAVRIWPEITLPGTPESVRQFRALARAASATLYQAETAALLVSELVTNSIIHTRSGRPGGTVTVCVGPANKPGDLRISVCDDGARPSGLLDSEPGIPESGYGLGIVDTLAADWGVVLAAGGGSCIWCEIPEVAA